MNSEKPRTAVSVTDELERAVERAVARGEISSAEEVAAFAQEYIEGYNLRPQAELGGLSPTHALQLASGPWESGPKGEAPRPNGPSQPAVYLANDLDAEQVSGTPFYTWSYHFIRAIAATKGVEATTRDRLPRKFVDLTLQMDIWPKGYSAGVSRNKKVIHERDHQLLHVTRLVADLAELLTRQEGVFRVTQLGRRLTNHEGHNNHKDRNDRTDHKDRSDRSGQLFALLFETYFRALNLAQFDRCADAPGFQQTIAYPLWRFLHARRRWQTAEEIAPRLILPPVRNEIPLKSIGDYEWDQAPTLIKRRLLIPLVYFGLAESRPNPRDDGTLSGSDAPSLPRDEYRRTALFDEFVQFCPVPGSAQ